VAVVLVFVGFPARQIDQTIQTLDNRTGRSLLLLLRLWQQREQQELAAMDNMQTFEVPCVNCEPFLNCEPFCEQHNICEPIF